MFIGSRLVSGAEESGNCPAPTGMQTVFKKVTFKK